MKLLSYLAAAFVAIALFTSCQKEISLETGLNPLVPWQFSEGNNNFKGVFYDVYDTTKAGEGYEVVFVGSTPAFDSVLVAQISFPDGKIQPGTYNTSSVGNGFYFTDSKDTAHPVFLYTAESRSANANLKLVIDSYDPVTGIIYVSFSGTALNASHQLVTISQGRFFAKVR